jgi:hypothetical protein
MAANVAIASRPDVSGGRSIVSRMDRHVPDVNLPPGLRACVARGRALRSGCVRGSRRGALANVIKACDRCRSPTDSSRTGTKSERLAPRFQRSTGKSVPPGHGPATPARPERA